MQRDRASHATADTIRVVSLDARGALRMATRSLPPPQRGEVRVKVAFAGFNPVDSQVRKQLRRNGGAAGVVLGRDLAGVVERVGPGVRGFKVGDEVYGYVARRASSGTYAERINVPAELLAPKPRVLTLDQAAALPVAGITAWLALTALRLERTSSLFIAGGAGGVGTLALMLARAFGVRRIVATAGSDAARSHLIRVCGLKAAQIVSTRADDVVARAVARNDGWFDGVLDLVGGPLSHVCCNLVAVDGVLASAVDAPRRADFETLFERNAAFHAVGAHAYSLTEDRALWRRYRSILAMLGTLFEQGRLRPPPVSEVGPLAAETVARAHRLLDRRTARGKLVMACTVPSR